MIRGVRGAITVSENSELEILNATKRLVEEIIKENHLDPNDVASVFISVTDDLTAAFPAKALRSLNGWTYVPVMCMKEIFVPGSLEKCIRVMFHVNTDILPQEIKHIYLENSVILRPDLQSK